jgi:hypothetical protein
VLTLSLSEAQKLSETRWRVGFDHPSHGLRNLAQHAHVLQ